jgi:Uma2 family endonuclease
MAVPAKKLELTFPHYCTVEEYFQLCEQTDEKLEYLGSFAVPRGGMAVAMAGASEDHKLITSNVGGELRARLRGTPCRAYGPDAKVGVRDYPSYVHPDAMVICGPTEYDERDTSGQTAAIPRLIVEVLSPTSEAYDRGEKFQRYMASQSLEEYVLVTQREPRVELFSRHPGGGWLLMHYVGLDAVAHLRSVDVELPLAEVFLSVAFPAAPEAVADRSPAPPTGD